MKKFFLIPFLIGFILLFLTGFNLQRSDKIISGAPPYDPSASDFVTESEEEELLKNWKRPEGPTKVALQVGHWKNEEVPDELHRLRGNTGAQGGGKTEWEVNYQIALETQKLLENEGITVDILPATIPPHYFSDVFVAIHADGSEDPSISGYKAAAYRRDITRKGDKLVDSLHASYEDATGLTYDPNISRNMTGYYAFSWRRYEHAVHPMTVSAIMETGFLTNYSDRQMLIYQPEVSAEGIANGILNFLHSENLISG